MEDATLILLNLLYSDQGKTDARLLFVDFSSAFNAIQPHVMAQKLISHFTLDLSLVGWILFQLSVSRPLVLLGLYFIPLTVHTVH